MKVYFRTVGTLGVFAHLAGCTNIPPNMPLLFAETNTIGIGISATAADQGGDFTLGYKSKDVAIVPVVVIKADGTVEHIRGKEEHEAGSKDPHTFQDAYSVLGQFDTRSSRTGQEVVLGRFFATGQAAVYLAEGFKAKLEGGAPQEGDTPATPAPAAPQ